MNILKLDTQLKHLVRTERKITYEILLLIQTLDVTKGYREFRYSSLFEYLTKEIGYSEGAAQRRISSARLLKECPEVEKEIQSGEMNLSQIALAQVAFQQEKKAGRAVSQAEKVKVLMSLKGKNMFETKKLLKQQCASFQIPKSQVEPVDGNVHVTLQFTDSEWQDVQSLMTKLSHKVPDQRIEQALLYWARELKKKENKQTSPPLRRQVGRGHLPASVQRLVFSKAQNQCQFQSSITGQRCESRHFLEIDHRKPLALGGSNDIENLRVLCRSHNQLMAKAFGLSGIRSS